MTFTPPATRPREAGLSAAWCDICGRPRERDERRRLVWDSGLGDDVVLADLCLRCATQVDDFLDLYGGRGRQAIRLVQTETRSARPTTATRKLGGVAVRSLVYLLIGLASFLVVTLVTMRG